ncbi:MAG: carboxypeptidase-like regulatory domain-containing protein, partial [Acidobacteriota bacterium]
MNYLLLSKSGVRLLTLAALALSAFAQSERGIITGAVRDTSGAVVPGASIKIVNTATNVTLDTVSNVEGE